ncbi:MAG TPA: ATP-binding cassette domain-containing protein, partial [Gemmatimonadaceae bacterium]|nr:ATP-binding cassette domain-containing protein [Gemmatimonadaceae bacterium]
IARNIAGQNSRQAKGRRKRLERLPRLSAPVGEEGTMALRLEIAERGGDQVAVADKVTIAVGERTLIERFSGRVMRGDRLGIVGPNGAGKSTLLRALVGERAPDAGELKVGNSIRVAYYDQQLGQVPLDKPLYDVIAELRPQWERRLVQGHLGRFGFSGDEVQRRASTLSGGERARVALAMLTLTRANLLVLDEPTNHLDVESIEVLEDAIEGYEGTVMLVSHDRAMLRALATKVWVLHDCHITEFDGSFAEWEVVSEERAHAASVRASEEVALRRMDEKKRTARRAERPATPDVRRQLRAAQERAQRAERDVAELEREVTSLTATLDDPELYTRPGGVQEANRLGTRLDALRARLDAALATWEQETATLESLERDTTPSR